MAKRSKKKRKWKEELIRRPDRQQAIIEDILDFAIQAEIKGYLHEQFDKYYSLTKKEDTKKETENDKSN